ncbi:MAG: winged helix-turn-helix domain-containing protein [Streptosporangiaceae bacterium]
MSFEGSGGDNEPVARPLRHITDPKTMRALAHPTRLALIEALGDAGTLTATEASEIVGESPTNCAFHLRTLAKYGYVEETGEGRGRQRPWRLAHVGMRFSSGEGDVEAATASRALGRLLEERWLDRWRQYRDTQHTYPDEWQDVFGSSQSVHYVTLDEAQQLQREYMDLLLRYRDRLEDPAKRPKGAIPMEALVFTFPHGRGPEEI